MAWATTAAIVAVVATVGGATVSAVGQHNAAVAASQTAEYNANIQRAQAVQESDVAAENARRKQDQANKIIGAQRAALAANGLAMEGTPLAVLGETSTVLERDILDIGFDATNRERQLLASANLSLFEGKAQSSALNTQAWASVISGIGSAVGGYTKATGSIGSSQSSAPAQTKSFLG